MAVQMRVYMSDGLEVKDVKHFYSSLFLLRTKSGQSEGGKRCSMAKSVGESDARCTRKRQAELGRILPFAFRMCTLARI